MSANLLREAAAKMRERAEASSPSPWVQTVWPKEVSGVYSQAIEDTHEFDPEIARTLDKPDAEHIASWHPAVALAVADWLEAVAAVHWQKRSDRPSESHYNAETEHVWFDGDCDESCWTEAYICNGCGTAECKPEISGRALAVASAYLGEA